MKQKIFAAAKLTITALLFVYIFSKIDLHQFSATLRNARMDILLCGFLILLIGHYICIYRWRMLMRPLMPILSVGNLLGIYCIGLFFNMIFPTVIGGDVVKMYYAGKPSNSYPQSFAAAFLDRDAGMLAMMIIACVAVLLYPVSVPGVPVSLIIWSVFLLFILGNIAIFVPSCHRLLIDILRRLNLARIAKKIDLISNAFQIMGKQKAVLLWSLMISFANQLLVISVTWITALGLRMNISPRYFLIFVPVITLISMIPISLNGMGLREYSFQSLFGAIGVLPASCIALGIISSITLIITSVPGGVIYVFFKNRADKQQLAAFDTELS
jgi:glycosyltransferase 2 family protein